jgi:hypothetical protein
MIFGWCSRLRLGIVERPARGNGGRANALVSAMSEKQITHLVGLALGGLLFVALALNALAS